MPKESPCIDCICFPICKNEANAKQNVGGLRMKCSLINDYIEPVIIGGNKNERFRYRKKIDRSRRIFGLTSIIWEQPDGTM